MEGGKRADQAEFELVTQALWTDPNDQSGWLYHRWLIGSSPPEDVLRREVKNVRELHDTEPDSKCESDFSMDFRGKLAEYIGCMNALAHDCSLLTGMGTTSPEEKLTLLEEARKLYKRLEVIDEDRKERYQDLSQRTLH